jgi:hypothetical protein
MSEPHPCDPPVWVEATTEHAGFWLIFEHGHEALWRQTAAELYARGLARENAPAEAPVEKVGAEAVGEAA